MAVKNTTCQICEIALKSKLIILKTFIKKTGKIENE